MYSQDNDDDDDDGDDLGGYDLDVRSEDSDTTGSLRDFIVPDNDSDIDPTQMTVDTADTADTVDNTDTAGATEAADTADTAETADTDDEDTIVPMVIDAEHASLVERLLQRDNQEGPRRSLRSSVPPETYRDDNYEELVFGGDCSSDLGNDPEATSGSDDEDFACGTESDDTDSSSNTTLTDTNNITDTDNTKQR